MPLCFNRGKLLHLISAKTVINRLNVFNCLTSRSRILTEWKIFGTAVNEQTFLNRTLDDQMMLDFLAASTKVSGFGKNKNDSFRQCFR